MLLGTRIGTFAGIIPGLSSGMSVALFLPLTFIMTPLHGIIFLVSIYVSVGYGGAMTAILLNTPGSPRNAVTTLDGFELTKQGAAAEALGYSICSSVYGGVISYVAMLLSIGIVPTGEWRSTYGEPYLAEGLPIIPVLIGMFVFSELMLMSFREYVIDSITVKRSLRDIFRGFSLPRWTWPAFARSTGLRIIVGLWPTTS